MNKKISQSDSAVHRRGSSREFKQLLGSDNHPRAGVGPLQSNSSVSTLNYVLIKAVNNKATRIRPNLDEGNSQIDI